MNLRKKIPWWWTLVAVVAVPAIVFAVYRNFPGLVPPESRAVFNGAFTGYNGFDLSNAALPKEHILRGGPPRDGIPSIDHPKFVSVGKADFLKDDDIVIGVTYKGLSRAYPLRILVWHEIANDAIGDFAYAVTYCPLCGTAMVFDRTIGDRRLEFGVSGLLYQSDVLLYDRETESLWSQLAMKCVAGKQVGTALKWLSSEHMAWKEWKAKHPESQVMSTDTGFRRDYSVQPYEGYEEMEETMFPVPENRKEFTNKTWVLGVALEGQAKAYPVDKLPSGETVKDSIGRHAIEVVYDASKRFSQVRDGANHRVIPSVMVYWFAWQGFYPQTEIWSP